MVVGPREKVQFYSKLQQEFRQLVDIGLSDSEEEEDAVLFERHSYEEVKQHNKPRPVQVRACDVENIKRVCEQN